MASVDRYKCLECNRLLSRAQWFQHQRHRHFHCPCGKSVVGEKAIERHTRTCGTGRTCSICGDCFTSCFALRRHERTPHWTCNACGVSLLRGGRTNHLLECPGLASHSRRNSPFDECMESGSVNATPSPPPPPDESHRLRDRQQLMSDAQIADATRAYQVKAAFALAKAKYDNDILLRSAPPESRTHRDSQAYKGILASSTTGCPITSDEYLRGDINDFRGKFIICSSLQAKSILKLGPPLLPIVIPGDLNDDADRRVSIEEYLKVIEAGRSVYVHDFHLKARDFRPRQLLATTAIQRFQDASRGPINMLDLPSYRKNPIPSCLSGLRDYDLLTAIDGPIGKKTSRSQCGLRESAGFQLLGKKGAKHLPHIDRHGVMTTIFVEEGEKLWICWPGLGYEHLQFIEHPAQYPPGQVALSLEPGTLLIQPPGCLHSPDSRTDVFISGTMHLHSRGVRASLECTLMELKNPLISNEDVSPEYIELIACVLNLWKQQKGPWDWGTDQEYEDCLGLIEEIKLAYSKPSQRRVMKAVDGKCHEL